MIKKKKKTTYGMLIFFFFENLWVVNLVLNVSIELIRVLNYVGHIVPNIFGH